MQKVQPELSFEKDHLHLFSPILIYIMILYQRH